jgi:hypothetical protein
MAARQLAYAIPGVQYDVLEGADEQAELQLE